MSTYSKIIQTVKETSDSLLDAMLAVQEIDGYLTENAMQELAEAYHVHLTQIYESASFYRMIRFAPKGKNIVQICHNAPCHVAGAAKTIEAFEKALGIAMGETTADNMYTLEYSECIGQCHASPSVVINGNIYTGITSDKVPELLKTLS